MIVGTQLTWADAPIEKPSRRIKHRAETNIEGDRIAGLLSSTYQSSQTQDTSPFSFAAFAQQFSGESKKRALASQEIEKQLICEELLDR